MSVYGDITPRTAAYAVKEMLKRGMPYLVLEKFGQTYPLPTSSTKVAKFRRYFLTGSTGAAGTGTNATPWGVPLSITPLTEGVTPAGLNLSNHDYTITLAQFGDFTTITDVILDTHEDQVLAQCTEVLGEQAALTVETLRYNVLKAGTNVFYGDATAGVPAVSRVTVLLPITLKLQRSVTTALNRQNAKKLTSIVKSTPNFQTQPIGASYIAIVHPDMETDIRNLVGFTPVERYGTMTPFENEIGWCEQVRYLSSTVAAPFITGTALVAAAPLMRSDNATNINIYPVLYLARDAYGIVPLKGATSLTPMVVNPTPSITDPLGQRGTVGWKTMQGAIILNDAWMLRLEVAATA